MSVGLFFLVFFLLLFAALPIAGCFAFMTVFPNIITGTFSIDSVMAVRTMANGLNSFTLLAIPLFVLAGIIMAGGESPKNSSTFLLISLETEPPAIPALWWPPACFMGRSPARRLQLRRLWAA